MDTDDEKPVESIELAPRPLHTPDLTVDRVRTATHYSRQHLEEWIANAERAWVDEDREARLEAQQCRWCFYATGGRIVMPAFHQRGCESCKEILTYTSSDTNPLCKPCGKKLNLCVKCRADVSLADRRKLEKKLPPDRLGGRISSATSAKRKTLRRVGRGV
jgi:predicted RNA-binding Zn-ribbon protein involved in translation (DUF1610 family)